MEIQEIRDKLVNILDSSKEGAFSSRQLDELIFVCEACVRYFSSQSEVEIFNEYLSTILTALEERYYFKAKKVLQNKLLPIIKQKVMVSALKSPTAAIEDQYTDFMYPDDWRGTVPDTIRRAAIDRSVCIDQGAFYNLDILQHLSFPEWIPHKQLRVLNAGCGTGEALVTSAIQYPEVSFTGIDVSSSSLGRAQSYIKELNIKNVELIKGNILEMALSDQFDIIQSSGVIHHLADPQVGLINLKRHLKPNGIIVIFVYGEYGRFEIGLFQEAVKLLQSSMYDRQEGLKIVRSILGNISAENRIVNIAYKMDVEKGDQHIVDLLINANEYRFNMVSLSKLVEGAGLHIIDVINHETYDPATYFNNPYLIEKVKNLSFIEKCHLAELVNGKLAKQMVICSHNGNYGNFLHLADGNSINYIPYLSPYLEVTRNKNKYLLRINQEKMLELAYRPKEITITPSLYPFIESVNGQKTVAELHNVLQIPWDEYWHVIRTLYDNKMLFLHCDTKSLRDGL